MRNSVFGWSLPPGCTHAMIEAQCEEGPCAVCGKSVDACVCAECATCGEVGNPRCYATRGGHGMRLTREQAISREECRLEQLRERVREQEQAVQYLRDGVAFVDRLDESPDPWR